MYSFGTATMLVRGVSYPFVFLYSLDMKVTDVIFGYLHFIGEQKQSYAMLTRLLNVELIHRHIGWN